MICRAAVEADGILFEYLLHNLVCRLFGMNKFCTAVQTSSLIWKVSVCVVNWFENIKRREGDETLFDEEMETLGQEIHQSRILILAQQWFWSKEHYMFYCWLGKGKVNFGCNLNTYLTGKIIWKNKVKYFQSNLLSILMATQFLLIWFTLN